MFSTLGRVNSIFSPIEVRLVWMLFRPFVESMMACDFVLLIPNDTLLVALLHCVSVKIKSWRIFSGINGILQAGDVVDIAIFSGIDFPAATPLGRLSARLNARQSCGELPPDLCTGIDPARVALA